MKIARYLSMILCLGTFFLSQQAQSQFFLSKKKAALTGVRTYLGTAFENYNSLSAKGLYAMLKPNQGTNFDISRYQRTDNFAAETYGGVIGFDLIFNPKNALGEINRNREIRVGMNINIERELMIDVSNHLFSSNPQWVGLCLIENNVDLNAAYIFKTSGRDGVQLYGGPGATLSTAFGNRFLFVGDTNNTGEYKAYGSNYIRTYAIGGVNLQLWKFSMFLEGNLGIGAQVVYNGDVNFATNYRVTGGVGFNFN